MNKIAFASLLFIFCAMTSAMLLASGEPIARVVLLLAGILLWLIGSRRVLSRSRARRNQPETMAGSFLDIFYLNGHEWASLALFGGGGALLFIVALTCIPGGA